MSLALAVLFVISVDLALGQDNAKIGKEVLENLFSEKVISFENGPYKFDPSKFDPSHLVKSLEFKKFSLITSGKSDSNSDEFWEKREPFTYNGTIEAERVNGVVGWTVEMFDGILSVETAKSAGVKECRVIGTSRQYSPLGRTSNFAGNSLIKVLYQNTVVKKPFRYVINDYMIDASTRPIYPTFHGPLDLRFHFNYQIDPRCPLGLNRTESSELESILDRTLYNRLRRVIVANYIRRYYNVDGTRPYAESIGAATDEDDSTSTFTGDLGLCCYSWPD